MAAAQTQPPQTGKHDDEEGKHTSSLELVPTGGSTLDDEVVVGTAQTTVTGNDDEGDVLNFTLGEKRTLSNIGALQTANDVTENTLQGLGEGGGT